MDNPNIDTKALFAPKKGKEATRGQKTIQQENLKTIKFYSIAAISTLLIRLAFAPSHSLITSFAVLVQFSTIFAMYYMDIDLELKGGVADFAKDITITTSLLSGLSIFSNLVWLLWLWLPAYVGYKFWMTVMVPYIFQEAPEKEEPKSEKKKKKKILRANYR